MKRLTAATLTAAMLIALTACSKEPEQTTEAPVIAAATTAAETTETSETPETTVETAYFAPPAWEGNWQATDTEEHFEITTVTDDGIKVVFYHFEEGQIEQFKYDMEYDNPEKTIASEIGSANDHGGWEYTFNFKGDSIVVQSKFPDQTYARVADTAETSGETEA